VAVDYRLFPHTRTINLSHTDHSYSFFGANRNNPFAPVQLQLPKLQTEKAKTTTSTVIVTPVLLVPDRHDMSLWTLTRFNGRPYAPSANSNIKPYSRIFRRAYAPSASIKPLTVSRIFQKKI
jgi:hypothetical protein